MVARRQGRLAHRLKLMEPGRWAGAVLLVAGLIGVNTVVAQAAVPGLSLDQVDVATSVAKPDSVERAAFGPADLRVFGVAAEDDEDADNEEVEEEFEEDGLRPSGQAEQREQKKGERSETKNEDVSDSPASE
jgi:hypothetical protein